MYNVLKPRTRQRAPEGWCCDHTGVGIVTCICLTVSGACSALGGILSAIFMMRAVKSIEGIEALRACLNTERPHQGYRNMGKRPIDTINAYLAVTQEAS